MRRAILGLLLAGPALAATGSSTPPLTLAPDLAPLVGARGGPGSSCDVALDDGEAETGYGWVPSVLDGRYVQRFGHQDIGTRFLDRVCICWLRTRQDDSIDFAVEIYLDDGGQPADEPHVSIPAHAEGVPELFPGAFYDVELDVTLPPVGPYYVGVRWDASVDQFFFVCADHSESTPVVDGFYREERGDEWTSVLETSDPIFTNHRAMMIRLGRGLPPLEEVPVLPPLGLLVLAMLLLGVGIWRLRSPVAPAAAPLPDRRPET